MRLGLGLGLGGGLPSSGGLGLGGAGGLGGLLVMGRSLGGRARNLRREESKMKGETERPNNKTCTRNKTPTPVI
ncbi:hypothetical protein BU16DRAFT_527206 [Lophium mytilinum]|uniref:Uncharacterized protein n=1 Tax=Lophium mytilinum TaxID=390894 RepID=A0A6A6QTA8_9PEZI|nr:hypothetical protein BU16DRAFT_527206 [Lophium mytilinum]